MPGSDDTLAGNCLAKCRRGVGAPRMLQLFFNAANSIFQCLLPIYSRANVDRAADSRRSHVMQRLMTFFNCFHNLFPLAFYIGSIAMQSNFQSRLHENLFAGSNIGSEADANA
jgi:hypothetical protein